MVLQKEMREWAPRRWRKLRLNDTNSMSVMDDGDCQTEHPPTIRPRSLALEASPTAMQNTAPFPEREQIHMDIG